MREGIEGKQIQDEKITHNQCNILKYLDLAHSINLIKSH